MSNLSIDSLAGGALKERFNDALADVLANILDPNTDAVKTRKLNIGVSFRPNKHRNLSCVSFNVKTTLQPASEVETEILFERDTNGKLVAEELAKGQIAGQIKAEEFLNEGKNKVVNMK